MSGSRIIELIKQQAAEQTPLGIEMATVVSPPPALKIRIDNMKLNFEGDDLIVCEHLLEHEISYSTSTGLSSSTISEWEDSSPPKHNHTHQLIDVIVNQQKLTVHNRLETGDRVVVMALPGGQQYLVWDKAVIMNG